MKISDNTLESSINYFKTQLQSQYDSSELEQLMAITFNHYFGLTRIDLTVNSDKLFSESDLIKIIHTVKGLKRNIPLAYILGEWEFYGIPFKVDEHTLIPRQETEGLVELIIKENKHKKEFSIFDVGTGTGCIAIALKKYLPDASVFACDVSDEAIIVAISNADKNKLEVSFSNVDILSVGTPNDGQKYDVIVSNPPYITVREKKLMSNNVLDFEPHLALFVKNEEPLLFYSAIADFAWNNLNKNGKLYFEINESFGNEVRQLLIGKNFKNVNIVKDINGKDRIASCNID